MDINDFLSILDEHCELPIASDTDTCSLDEIDVHEIGTSDISPAVQVVNDNMPTVGSVSSSTSNEETVEKIKNNYPLNSCDTDVIKSLENSTELPSACDQSKKKTYSVTTSVTTYLSPDSTKNKQGEETKRKRTKYTADQLSALEQLFTQNKFLGKKENRIEVAKKLNLQENQVKTWFQNRRVKESKKLKMTTKKELHGKPPLFSSQFYPPNTSFPSNFPHTSSYWNEQQMYNYYNWNTAWQQYATDLSLYPQNQLNYQQPIQNIVKMEPVNYHNVENQCTNDFQQQNQWNYQFYDCQYARPKMESKSNDNASHSKEDGVLNELDYELCRLLNVNTQNNCQSGLNIDLKIWKKPRTRHTPFQLQKLEEQFNKNHFIEKNHKIELAHKLNLTDDQIRNWFQKRRMKEKKRKEKLSTLLLPQFCTLFSPVSPSFTNIRNDQQTNGDLSNCGNVSQDCVLDLSLSSQNQWYHQYPDQYVLKLKPYNTIDNLNSSIKNTFWSQWNSQFYLYQYQNLNDMYKYNCEPTNQLSTIYPEGDYFPGFNYCNINYN